MGPFVYMQFHNGVSVKIQLKWICSVLVFFIVTVMNYHKVNDLIPVYHLTVL